MDLPIFGRTRTYNGLLAMVHGLPNSAFTWPAIAAYPTRSISQRGQLRNTEGLRRLRYENTREKGYQADGKELLLMHLVDMWAANAGEENKIVLSKVEL